MKPIKLLAKNLAESPLLYRGAKLWKMNQKNSIHLTKLDKLITGVYLILKDYSDDKFPPNHQQIQTTYQNEIDFADRHINDQFTSIKPFVYENPIYYQHFFDFWKLLTKYYPNSNKCLLELGAGTGWLSILLARLGFKMTASTIAQSDCDLGSHKAKQLELEMNFVCSPCEEIDSILENKQFDGIFIYEALHHCYDWQKVCENVFLLLKHGGYFFILNEPNLIHTAVSYRVAKLENTHEVGFKRWELINVLTKLGFKVKVVRGDWIFRPMWIVAFKD